MRQPTGHEPRHICGECNHKSADHHTTATTGGAPRCCFGWCLCSLRKSDVTATYPATSRPVWTAYDQATGSWAS